MLRMMIAACLCLASMPLAGCATSSSSHPTPSEQHATAYERASVAYARIRSTAVAAMPYLPDATAARVQLRIDAADAALVLMTRGASTAERATALAQLVAAAATISAVLAPASS